MSLERYQKGGICPRLIFLLALFLFLSASITCTKRNSPTASLSTDDPSYYVFDQRLKILDLTNETRADFGTGQLILDPYLNAVAQAYAEDMAVREFFSHMDPDGLTMLDRLNGAGIPFYAAGENIAWYPSAETAILGWIESPGHYENLVRPMFNKIGIGVYNPDPDLASNYYYVQLFTN